MSPSMSPACQLKNCCKSFAGAGEFGLNSEDLLVSLLPLFLSYVFVYSMHWDEGAFSGEVQGICSHIIDFLLEKTTEEMCWMR